MRNVLLAVFEVVVIVSIFVASSYGHQEERKDVKPVCKGDVQTTCSMEQIEYAKHRDWLVRCRIEVKGKEIFNRVLPSPRPQSRDEAWKQVNRFLDEQVHTILRNQGYVWQKECKK